MPFGSASPRELDSSHEVVIRGQRGSSIVIDVVVIDRAEVGSVKLRHEEFVTHIVHLLERLHFINCPSNLGH
jgi:hypothetical protein